MNRQEERPNKHDSCHRGFPVRFWDDSEQDCRRSGGSLWNGYKWVEFTSCALNPVQDLDEILDAVDMVEQGRVYPMTYSDLEPYGVIMYNSICSDRVKEYCRPIYNQIRWNVEQWHLYTEARRKDIC